MTASPAPKKLLDQMKEALRTRHCSIRTEKVYLEWARRFILFHDKRHPKDVGSKEIAAFLTDLAVKRHVAAPVGNCFILPEHKHAPDHHAQEIGCLRAGRLGQDGAAHVKKEWAPRSRRANLHLATEYARYHSAPVRTTPETGPRSWCSQKRWEVGDLLLPHAERHENRSGKMCPAWRTGGQRSKVGLSKGQRCPSLTRAQHQPHSRRKGGWQDAGRTHPAATCRRWNGPQTAPTPHELGPARVPGMGVLTAFAPAAYGGVGRRLVD